MTFHSRTSNDVSSPIISDISIGNVDSPQLVAQSLEEMGESYVVIAGSKPLSIIIKKCILSGSVPEYVNVGEGGERCDESGNLGQSVEEGRCSQHCVEIMCMSNDATSTCPKSAELRLDSISRNINECDAVTDGTAICEIDCGLVPALGTQNSDVLSDGTCDQQNDNNIVENDHLSENFGDFNIVAEENSVSKSSLTRNNIEQKAYISTELYHISEAEACLMSDDRSPCIETYKRRNTEQLCRKECEISDNLKAVLLDENAVSCLSPSYTFYGTVERPSHIVVTSEERIGESDCHQDICASSADSPENILHGTCVSSVDSPESPVLGSASKVQKGMWAKRSENDKNIKGQLVETLRTSISSDISLHSYQKAISSSLSGLPEHDFLRPNSENAVDEQWLEQDRPDLTFSNALTESKKHTQNFFGIIHQESTMNSQSGREVDSNNCHGVMVNNSDYCASIENTGKSHETSSSQNLTDVTEIAGNENSISSNHCSSNHLSDTYFHNSTALQGTEESNISEICNNSVTQARLTSALETVKQEESSFLNAKYVEKEVIGQYCNTSVANDSKCTSEVNITKETCALDLTVDVSTSHRFLKTSEDQLNEDSASVSAKQGILNKDTSEKFFGDYSEKTALETAISQHSFAWETCGTLNMSEPCDLTVKSLVRDTDKLGVPKEKVEQQSSQSKHYQKIYKLPEDLSHPPTQAVSRQENEQHAETSSEFSQFYNQGNESSVQNDNAYEGVCFDSEDKTFDNIYFDQLLTSPILDTSKVTERSRFLSVCENSSSGLKVEQLIDEKQDSGNCDKSVVHETKLELPGDICSNTSAIGSACNSTVQLENSPLMFTSDDESFDTNWESMQNTLKENKSPVKPAAPSSVNNEVIEAQHKKLKKIQELLLGIPPPPSITMPNHTVEEMLRLIKQNEHLMVQNSSKNCENTTGENCAKRSAALRDVLNTSWPQIKESEYFDIQYNHGAVSEELDRQYQRLQERYVGRETASSCNSWFTTWNMTKTSGRRQRSLGQSPGSRLSHLARRRQSFSSCNLQPAGVSGKLSGTMHRSAIERRLIMVDTKKEEKQSKNRFNNHRDHRHSISGGENDNRLKSSRRALFQSPVDDKKAAFQLKSRVGSYNMKIDTSKVDSWGGGTKYTEKRELSLNENFNVNGKRVISDSQSHPRKISRRLVFDASQPADHFSSHNREVNRYFPVASQLMERKSNSSYSNGIDRTRPAHSLSSSQVTLKNRISGSLKKKLLWAVAEALRRKGITMNHHLFQPYASSLTRLLLREVGNNSSVQSKEGSCKITSEHLVEAALRHVHSVVQKNETGHS